MKKFFSSCKQFWLNQTLVVKIFLPTLLFLGVCKIGMAFILQILSGFVLFFVGFILVKMILDSTKESLDK